jgi:hypothetical protein
MLQFNRTQDSKRRIKDKKGQDYVDFLIKDLVNPEDFSIRPIVIDLYIVTKEDSMRADLISQKMYGFMDNIETILKLNDISNPFCVDEGDILFTFDVTSMNRAVRSGFNVDETEQQDIRAQYLTPEKKSTVDARLREFSKRDTARKPIDGSAQPALPPNYANFGDQEIQLRNGKIILGPNVTRQDKDCEKPLSKSEFISRLIKNRLK